MEESLKRPEETVKKIAESLKPMLFLQVLLQLLFLIYFEKELKTIYFLKFQDEVSIKTLQNNIRSMFKQWEKDGEKFEVQMMKRGVSQQAINHSKKI